MTIKNIYDFLSVTNFYDRGRYRPGRPLNLTLLHYAILGCDGQVLFIRAYPPIKPKDLHPAMVQVPEHMVKQVKPGWVYNRAARSFINPKE